MYYIFEAEIRGKKHLTFADVLGEMPNFLNISYEWDWWSDFPLPVPFPKTTFAVDETVYQDAYETGSVFSLHSEKLAKLIQALNVKCEHFPVSMVSRKSGKNISSKYFAFHLMETYNVIDYSKSNLVEEDEPVPDFILKARLRKGSDIVGKRIVSIELTEEILSSQYQLFRDKERPRLVFVHPTLKQTFDASGIQGCKYTHYKDFRDIALSDIGIIK